jgi:ABC-type Fe3+/spermidine/putrescine transport system ATPase subunit
MARLDIEGLQVELGGTLVLHGVSLAVAEGECLALLGPSGCGKTTTLRAVAGFAEPSSGEIRIGGRPVRGLPPHKRNLGLVFQDYALFPHMSVAENVGYGLRMRGVARTQAAQRVEEALALVRLTGFGDRLPARLSGGQRQRVALARALVVRPDILLLDEPLGALDRRLRDEMQVELTRIRREAGATTVIVTHDQEEALSLADRVAVMFDGRIAEIGAPAELYERPRSQAVMEFLGEANFWAASVTAGGAIRLLPDGPLLTEDAASWPEGARLRVGLRPEHLAPCALDAPGAIPAVVRQVVYKGAHAELHAEGPSGLALRARLPGRDAPSPGARIGLRPAPGRLILFGEDGTAGGPAAGSKA